MLSLLLTTVLGAILVLSFYNWYFNTTTFHFLPTERNKMLVASLPSYGSFPVWGFSGWAQSVYCSKIRKGPAHASDKMYSCSRSAVLEYKHGPFALDWVISDSKFINEDTPLLLYVLSGVSGHFENDYVRKIVARLKDHYQVVVWNWPGCGDSPPTHHFPTFGDYECIKTSIDHLYHKNPKRSIYAVGMSMGGLLLSKYLAEVREKTQIKSAVIVSAAGHAGEGARAFTNKLLNLIIAGKLLEPLKRNLDKFQDHPHIDVQKILTANTVNEYEKHYTEKLLQKDIDDHYNEVSPALCKITIPTILVNSLDDPIVPRHLLEVPLTKSKENPNLILVHTRFGGHLGWVEGGIFSLNSETWIENLIHSFFLNFENNQINLPNH